MTAELDLPTQLPPGATVQPYDDGRLGARINFPNGRGASVIRLSYTVFMEVAVLDGDELDYGTPITRDVLGGLDAEGLSDVLFRIAALPPTTNATEED